LGKDQEPGTTLKTANEKKKKDDDKPETCGGYDNIKSGPILENIRQKSEADPMTSATCDRRGCTVVRTRDRSFGVKIRLYSRCGAKKARSGEKSDRAS